MQLNVYTRTSPTVSNMCICSSISPLEMLVERRIKMKREKKQKLNERKKAMRTHRCLYMATSIGRCMHADCCVECSGELSCVSNSFFFYISMIFFSIFWPVLIYSSHWFFVLFAFNNPDIFFFQSI